MKKSVLLLFLALTSISFGQTNLTREFAKIFNKANKDELNRIAHTLNFEPNKEIRVFVFFKINEKGEFYDINARSEHHSIEKEVIKLFKEFTADKTTYVEEEKIGKKLALPVVFKTENERARKRRLKKEKKLKSKRED
ncbi:hypothetical protein [Mesonia sp. HuA40]|uniref:hypothetical protein n=1 Tax=Mesonia sp. HuA40 TaxID=2602761 RepID=UPI0011CCCEC2|nr:hypothetical protein [Mesonia sp. HuA40]TXK70876.1 hypothetical protein FT993_09815 [Mesonia sp. HuA40]